MALKKDTLPKLFLSFRLEFCGPGSFSRDGLAPCTTCRVGYFQPQTRSRSCQKCPEDTATWRRGAKKSQECQCKWQSSLLGLKKAGFSFSHFYWLPAATLQYCHHDVCARKRATYMYSHFPFFFGLFLALCLPGLVSETGLASDIDICLPCPKGYFQEAAGQRGCLKCPSQVGIEQASDNNEGGGGDSLGSATIGLSSILQCPGVEKSTLTTSVSWKKLLFHFLNITFFFVHFQILSQLEFLRINECFKEPCLNGGKCEALKNGFICRCQSGYQGV